ncbi:MAG: hypothetical protein R2779_12055 [Crocinitomicaceae bacterium]
MFGQTDHGVDIEAWDPKETWALVSILIYAITLHLRFIPAMKRVNLSSMYSVVVLRSNFIHLLWG